MSVKLFINSVRSAGRGLARVFKNEQNFRIQVAIAGIVLALSFVFHLKKWEFITVLLLILIVLLMEIINTALEFFTDLLKPRLHHYAKATKDVMAAAVMLTSFFAALIGLIIFIPHFINLVK
ncbi:MAG: diacylglycerol kinase family protein [bacterium]